MRILATFAFSFAVAVFVTIYSGLDGVLLPLGGILALLAVVTGFAIRRKSRKKTRLLLILSGLSFGFLWTALYMAVFFQPARDKHPAQYSPLSFYTPYTVCNLPFPAYI